MSNFNLDDYDPVDSRIKQFYEDHPDGAIHTELQSVVDSPVAVFRASALVGERVVSTGYASEKEGEGYVNKTSHLENCETSAIGRALANFGYSGNKRPSREEMQKVQRAESTDPEAVKLRDDNKKRIEDHDLSPEQHEEAMAWLGKYALTVTSQKAAKNALDKRFPDDSTNT